jgi:hypothetical protein
MQFKILLLKLKGGNLKSNNLQKAEKKRFLD